MILTLPDTTRYTAVSDTPARPLWRVKPDTQTEYWNYAVRPAAVKLGSAPAVFRTGTAKNNLAFRRSRFTRAWQFYAADLLAMAQYGKPFADLPAAERKDITRAFNSLYAGNRAFTNKAGVDSRNNYITGEMRGEDPMIDPLICALDIVTEEAPGTMVKLLAFHPGDTPPDPVLNDPRVLWATTIRADGMIRNFPQLGGARVPYPFLADPAEGYYPTAELETSPLWHLVHE